MQGNQAAAHPQGHSNRGYPCFVSFTMDRLTMRKEILARRPKGRAGYSVYGSRVMPAIEFFNSLDNKDREIFYETLKLLLNDEDTSVRDFAVALCLGFFVLRDSVE